MLSTAIALLQEYNEAEARRMVWYDHAALDSYLAGYNVFLNGYEKDQLKNYFPQP